MTTDSSTKSDGTKNTPAVRPTVAGYSFIAHLLAPPVTLSIQIPDKTCTPIRRVQRCTSHMQSTRHHQQEHQPLSCQILATMGPTELPAALNFKTYSVRPTAGAGMHVGHAKMHLGVHVRTMPHANLSRLGNSFAPAHFLTAILHHFHIAAVGHHASRMHHAPRC